MKNLSKLIHEFLGQPHYTPLTALELFQAMNLPSSQKKSFDNVLKLELKADRLQLLNKSRYQLKQIPKITGKIRFRQNGSAFFIPIDSSGQLQKHDELPVNHIANAFNNDIVTVSLEPLKIPPKKSSQKSSPSQKSPPPIQTHRVVVTDIVERAHTSLVGTVFSDSDGYFLKVDDPCFLYDVNIESLDVFPLPASSRAAVGDKVVLQLHPFDDPDYSPSGDIIEVLGKTHTPAAEFSGILRKYQLNPDFPPEVLQEAISIPSSVLPHHLTNRLDYRSIFTFTIDPDDAKDFDDALSIEQFEDGSIKVAIHIADVSAYVKSNSLLDQEAYKRGNSTYLVGTVIPMLPHSLSNGICSLVENQDRLTKSVIITFNKHLKITHTQLAHTVINSNKRLTYKQALGLLKEDSLKIIRQLPLPASHSTGSTGRALNTLQDSELLLLQQHIRLAWKIAKNLRSQRFQSGSLDLDMPEVKIYTDPHGHAERIEKIENDESHQLIEEFMLLANESVARILHLDKYAFISRVHDEPDPEKLRDLAISLSLSKINAGDLTHKPNLKNVLDSLKTHPQGHILKVMFLRSMKQACYRETLDGHYGLSKKFYAHFTSPIRRYSDLVVHRILERYLAEKSLPYSIPFSQKKYSLQELSFIASHLSSTERNSTDAERESIKIKMVEFFSRELSKSPKNIFKAIITELRQHGIFIELADSLVYGYIGLDTIKDDFYILSDNGYSMRGRRYRREFKVGDILDVVIHKVDPFKRQMDFTLSETFYQTPSPPPKKSSSFSSLKKLLKSKPKS